MKNDVKDWLPKEFDETKDLEEFRQYFLSEQFVLVSWDGCYGDDQDERFKLFLAKLQPELPPTAKAASAGSEQPQAEESSEALGSSENDKSLNNPTRYIHRDANFIGDTLGLYFAGDWYEDW